MYTEYTIKFTVDRDFEHLPILMHMAGGKWNNDKPVDPPPNLPNHPFFFCERWSSLFMMSTGIDLHDGYKVIYTNLTITFEVQSHIKDYDNEITKFHDWIMPYTLEEPGSYMGEYQYEEDTYPTMVIK